MTDDAETRLIFVHLPEPLEPEERELRYGDPLDAELKLAGLGFVSGGGALLEAPDDNGYRAIIYSGVDVDSYDLERGRALLRDHLPDLGCRPGTRLQFNEPDGHWEDVFDGEHWALRQRQPRSDGDA